MGKNLEAAYKDQNETYNPIINNCVDWAQNQLIGVGLGISDSGLGSTPADLFEKIWNLIEEEKSKCK